MSSKCLRSVGPMQARPQKTMFTLVIYHNMDFSALLQFYRQSSWILQRGPHRVLNVFFSCEKKTWEPHLFHTFSEENICSNWTGKFMSEHFIKILNLNLRDYRCSFQNNKVVQLYTLLHCCHASDGLSSF